MGLGAEPGSAPGFASANYATCSSKTRRRLSSQQAMPWGVPACQKRSSMISCAGRAGCSKRPLLLREKAMWSGPRP